MIYNDIIYELLNSTSTITSDYLEQFNNPEVTFEALLESQRNYSNFDLFISHSYADKETVKRINNMFEEKNFKTYIDWINDEKTLDRENVTKETAKRLQDQMKKSKALVYIHTENAEISSWMPWELGYFDGFKGKVVILKVDDAKDPVYLAEYLNLYPTLRLSNLDKKLVVNYNKNKNIKFEEWVNSDR